MTFISITALLALLYWLVVGGLAIHVVMRRPPVGVALAWVLMIFTLPLVGALAYLFIGERRLGRQRATRTSTAMASLRQWQEELPPLGLSSTLPTGEPASSLDRLAVQSVGLWSLAGNDVELLCDDQSVFDALIADIDQAKSHCLLCFYIWNEGGRVDEVIEALVRAAGRGVRCRALADATGSSKFLKSAAVDRLREAGIEMTTSLPTGLLRQFLVRLDLRNHRKIAVIDDRIAYTGSQNLVDPRFFKQDQGVGEWVDAMARLSGPAVLVLAGIFEFDWSVETGEAPRLPPHEAVEALVAANASDAPGTQRASSLIQVVPSGPQLNPEAIYRLMITALYSARREIVITTPYFIPDEAILTALISAAMRGVSVTLIVPARNDSILVRYASTAHFDELLSAGVRIALFQGGLLHTKSLTLDGEVSLFGSVNLDMRSLWLNFEISLFVYDPDFTDRLKTLQSGYLASSDFLGLDTWRQRSPGRRFVENSFRLLGPLL